MASERERDRPRTGVLFEPTMQPSFGGTKKMVAAANTDSARKERGGGFHGYGVIASAPASASPASASSSSAAATTAASHSKGQVNNGSNGNSGNGNNNVQKKGNMSHGGGGGHKKAEKFITPTRILSKPQQAATDELTPPTILRKPETQQPQQQPLQQQPAQTLAVTTSSLSLGPASASPAAKPASGGGGGASAAAVLNPALLYHRPVQLLDARMKLVGVDTLTPLLMDSAPTPSSSSAASSASSSSSAPSQQAPLPSPPSSLPCEFTVFGAIGSQHSGRSTILNSLARAHSSRRPLGASQPRSSEPTFVGGDRTRPEGFGVASAEDVLVHLSRTSGIDVLITPERNILIDTPPMDCVSGVQALAHMDCTLPPATSVDQAFQLQTIQTILLLLDCCHVLLVTCDSHTLMHMCKLLQRALLLRQHLTLDTHLLASRSAGGSSPPASASSSSSSFHALPDIVFVINKLPLCELVHPAAFLESSSYAHMLSNLFVDHHFRKQGAISAYGPLPLRNRSKAARENNLVNCFQLPYCERTAANSSGSGGAGSDGGFGGGGGESQLSLALQELTFQLLTLPKLCVSHRTSERDWLRHLSRVWQDLQVTPALAEFKTLLQKATPQPPMMTVRRADNQPMSHKAMHKAAFVAAAQAHRAARKQAQHPGAQLYAAPQQQQQQQHAPPPPPPPPPPPQGLVSKRRLYEPPDS